jgi:uncharacterized protein YecE (DUF72 family)
VTGSTRTRSNTRAHVRVGTAGWSLPRAAAAIFSSGGTHLQRYAAVFDAAEINSSFHRPHRRSTYERWAAAVPTHFRFSVKMPREITHDLQLRACATPLKKFLAEIAGLGCRLGCVLLQFPPSFAFDGPRVKSFMQVFRRHYSGAAVSEPRHATWFAPHAVALLAEFAIDRVGSDPALCAAAATPLAASGIAYWRLHGTPRKYYSEYPPEFVATLARTLAHTAASDRECWCIFDNTAHGFAVPNAVDLLTALRRKK